MPICLGSQIPCSANTSHTITSVEPAVGLALLGCTISFCHRLTNCQLSRKALKTFFCGSKSDPKADIFFPVDNFVQILDSYTCPASMLSFTEDFGLHSYYELNNCHTLPEDSPVQPYEHSAMSGDIMLCQDASYQVPGSSFPGDANHTSLTSIAWRLDVSDQGSRCNLAPAQFTESMGHLDDKTSQYELLSAVSDHKQANQLGNKTQLRLGSESSNIRPTVVVAESHKLKKRDRSSKKQSLGADSTGPQEFDYHKLPINPRRRQILESNRVSAEKSRLRKRDQVSALVSQERAMEDQNRYLASCHDSLTSEICHLKAELFQHTNCDCTLIQAYISHEARKSVESLLASSPCLDFYGSSVTPEDLPQAALTPLTL